MSGPSGDSVLGFLVWLAPRNLDRGLDTASLLGHPYHMDPSSQRSTHEASEAVALRGEKQRVHVPLMPFCGENAGSGKGCSKPSSLMVLQQQEVDPEP